MRANATWSVALHNIHYATATTLTRGGSERGGSEGGREAELVLHSPLSTPPSILHSVADVLRLIQHFTLDGPTTFYYYGLSKL